MHHTVWKYPIPAVGKFVLSMPIGTKPLSVHMQHGEPQLWAAVDPSAPHTEYSFGQTGTGETVYPHLPTDGYLGSYQKHDGNTVIHVFALPLHP